MNDNKKGMAKIGFTLMIAVATIILTYHFAFAASPSYMNITGGGSMATISGNIGIGTILPAERLTIYGSSPSGAFLVLNSTTPLFFINGSSGYIGIGTAVPQATLHINGSGSSSSGLLLSNGSAAFFWVNSTSAKVMIGDGTSYAETPGNYRLQVYGNVNASSYATNGTDYAEWVVKLDANENMEEGDVVAIVNGRATKNFNLMTKADSFMVVTARAGFIGGLRSDDSVAATFIGRVPVKISGHANSGDYIVADKDGRAVAFDKDEIAFENFSKVLGTAWESGTGMVMTAVGVRR